MFKFQIAKTSVKTIYTNNTVGPISPNLPNKTYAISRFLAKILSVSISSNEPISLNFFEISITNYFLAVMNDVIFKIEFPKFTLFNFYLIAFGGELNS
jgi:hypothetical protein